MTNTFRLISKLFGRKNVSTNDVSLIPEPLISETVDEIPMPISIDWQSLVRDIIEHGYKLEHFNVHDLRIVVGHKILTLICDRRELGLHSFGIYDYCSTSDEEGHKLMAQIIRENEDIAYKSLSIASSEDELWVNIADCTNRGAGTCNILYDQMIEVFEPVLLKFIKDNAVYNNVGLCVSNGDGTSLSAQFLCNKLKELGLNIHIAFIESIWNDMRMKDKRAFMSAQLAELSCTYKMFQFPAVNNIFDINKIEESERTILLEAVSYLKTVISE